MTDNVDTAEEAVRRYLTYLTDPESLVDTSLVEHHRKQLDEETDVVGRLKLLSIIENLETVDPDAIRKEFVTHARAFAERENIPVAAFRSMGVDKDTLNQAGLYPGGRRSTTAPRGRGTPARGRVSRDQIIASIPEGQFTIRDLETVTGASSLTVRKTIDDLVGDGTLTEHEPDPHHLGRGRAPKRYSRT